MKVLETESIKNTLQKGLHENNNNITTNLNQNIE